MAQYRFVRLVGSNETFRFVYTIAYKRALKPKRVIRLLNKVPPRGSLHVSRESHTRDRFQIDGDKNAIVKDRA